MRRNPDADYATLQWMACSPDGVALLPEGSTTQQSTRRRIGDRPPMWVAPVSLVTRLRMQDVGWIEPYGVDDLAFRITEAGRAFVDRWETAKHGSPVTQKGRPMGRPRQAR